MSSANSDLQALLTRLEGLASKASKPPWYVRDFRASEMRRLGWTGPRCVSSSLTREYESEMAENYRAMLAANPADEGGKG